MKMVDKFKKILLNNALLAFIILVCLSGINQYYEFATHQPYWHSELNRGLHFTIYFAILLSGLYKDRSILIVTSATIIILFIQLIYSSYFGIPISPTDISLFFANTREILHVFSQMLNIALIPCLVCGGAFAIIYITVKTLKTRSRSPYFWILLLLFLLISSFKPAKRIIMNAKNNDIYFNVSDGQYPSARDSLLISSQKTLLYYFIETLPHQLFLRSPLAQPIQPPLPLYTKHPNINIILIMGESLTDNHMSSYGYSRMTTPFLNSLKNNSAVKFKNGISAGVSTAVTLASFFNMAPRPDGSNQIASTNRNLFKMAKENGFETYFISAQAGYSLNVIKSSLFPGYINHYGESDLFGANYHHDVYDFKLADYFQSANFKKPTFMVLHERGSHSPYAERYPQEYDIFHSNQPSFQQSQIDTYDNSVRYTDAMIEKIVRAIPEKTHRPTLLIFTSDHGESLGEQGIYGHENVTVLTQHQVPIIFMAFNGADFNFLKQKNHDDINSRYMSHYELSEAIAWLLGYQPPRFSDQKSGYFVNGKALTGSAGFDQISFTPQGNLLDHLQ
jgi:glucan phosphoethanolaminetransferase (alkaline phosphatase superfamily)